MLARSAESLYWIGRYLERAAHLARLMRQQTESLVDSPVRDIYFGWHRIYGALGRQPHPGPLDTEADEQYTLADSFTLADDLTFEPTTPDSIRNCFAQARENARQVRHRISAQMWTSLNRPYLRLRDIEIQNIWASTPEQFYAAVEADIDTFRGVSSSTMYRDQGWHFIRMGSLLERAELVASLLSAQIAAVRLFDVPADAYWTSLLRLLHAFEAYQQGDGLEVDPNRVLELIVSNPQLPDSLSMSVLGLHRELSAIGQGPDRTATSQARTQADHLSDLLRSAWPGTADPEGLFAEFRDAIRRLHDLVTETYFDYPVMARPPRLGQFDQ
ncbi:MAG: alpha-E domain-containing protein [Acidimicrobiia bacterium]|nr:alpha-E domain-containing protein [Acidimicrobiia bacterium]MYF84967.1 alpha-E domain-containing protein [Acidimicrobiia bacterium]